MPVTATAALAARIDRAELSLVLGMAESARAAGVPVHTWPVGGTSAVLAEPGSPFNKLIALGFGPLPTEEELTPIEQAHAARQVQLQVELSTLADPAVGRLLTARGYLLTGFENVLARWLADVPDVVEGPIEVAEVGGGESDEWIRVVTDAFMHPDVFDGPAAHESFDRIALERAYRLFGAVPGVSRLVAVLDGRRRQPVPA